MRALRWISLGLLGLLLLSATRGVWTLDPDAAAYVSLGRSMATGEGYLLFGEPHAKYPPGLPGLLALLIRGAGPEAYQLFHAALVLCVLAAAVLASRLARRLGLGPIGAFVVGAGTGLSLSMFDLSVVYLRTEPLFTALSLGALLACLRSQSTDGGWRHALLAGLLTAAALATRLAGLGLLILPTLALLRPVGRGVRARSTLVLVIAGAFLAAWFDHGREVRAQLVAASDYTDEFLVAEPRDLTKTVRLDNPPLDAAGLARRVGGNARVFAGACAVLLSNVDKAANQLPVGVLLASLVALGLLVLMSPARARELVSARGSTPDPGRESELHAARLSAGFYALASIGLLLVWPFNQQERFYAPLLPLFLVAAGEGLGFALRELNALTRHPRGRLVALFIATVVLTLLVLQRSDVPAVLGRWSVGYAALLAVSIGATAVVIWCVRVGLPLRLPPRAPLLALALFAASFAHQRFVRWPQLQRDQAPMVANAIQVHPVLREVADRLAAEMPPDTIVMTDVPKMLQVLSGLRCVPMRYTVDPPRLVPGEAKVLFCTGSDPPEAGALVDALSSDWDALIELAPIPVGNGELHPTVWRLP